MRWRPIDCTLAVPDVEEDLIVLDARMQTITTISLITTKDVLLYFGPSLEPVTFTNSFLLKSGESYGERDIIVSEAIRFKNAVPGEQPRVRGIVWGR